MLILLEFEIMSVGSCEKVIENTKGVNGKQNIFKKDTEEVKRNIIEDIKKENEVFVTDYLNKRYVKIIQVSKLRYNNNFEEEIDKINSKNKYKIKEEVKKIIKSFDECISTNNYDELVKLIFGKFVIGNLSSRLGCKNRSDYEYKFINMIKEYEQFRDLVRNKIGIDI